MCGDTMTCKHNWNFVDGLTKRIRCTRCAAMQFVNPQDKYVLTDSSYGELKVQDPRPNNIIFYNTVDQQHVEIMRIDAKGVTVNPAMPVDDAAAGVIKALDGYVKALAQREYERGVLAGKAQRTWVGLTLDERLALAQDVDWAAGAYCEYAEKVEAKLKERNT